MPPAWLRMWHGYAFQLHYKPRNKSLQVGDCDNRESCGDGGGNGYGGTKAHEDFFDTKENGDPEDNSNDSSNEDEWDVADDIPNDGEDLEELLGQILHDRMGSNPEIYIVATLPLHDGNMLSMLCATLLIVNCCKTHSVSNMFMNKLLMLLKMCILPVGNCLPKIEYEARKILRRCIMLYVTKVVVYLRVI